ALTSGSQARITADYRKANFSQGVSFTSTSLWMDYPLLRKNENTGAVFLMFESENSGGFVNYNTVKVNLAVAKKITLNRLSHLSFGVGAGYQQFGLSLDGLTTSSQYTPGIGFNPELPNNEASGNYRTSFM